MKSLQNHIQESMNESKPAYSYEIIYDDDDNMSTVQGNSKKKDEFVGITIKGDFSKDKTLLDFTDPFDAIKYIESNKTKYTILHRMQ